MNKKLNVFEKTDDNKKYYNRLLAMDPLTMSQTAADSSNIFEIKKAVYCAQGAETGAIFAGGAARYKNYNYRLTGNNYSQGAYAVGTQTIVIELENQQQWNTSIPFNLGNSNDFNWSSSLYAYATSFGTTYAAGVGCKVLGIHYKPSNLEGQYGGRTYTKRAQSEYISTGAFYPLDGQVGTKSIKVFGGDIFLNMFTLETSHVEFKKEFFESHK